jgi:hypothetical protein
MGKAAQIISSVTGMPRRKAEKVEYQLKAAGLLVTEEQVEEKVEEKATKTKEVKEVSKQ